MTYRKTVHLLRPAPAGGLPLELEARCSGTVEKHFGRLEVSEFESSVDLTREEREQCEEQLIDHARSRAGWFGGFREQEPEARRYSL